MCYDMRHNMLCNKLESMLFGSPFGKAVCMLTLGKTYTRTRNYSGSYAGHMTGKGFVCR